jgi:hypothetical protein
VLVPQTFANSVRAFFDQIKGIFPDDVTISFPAEVKLLSLAGALLGINPVTPPLNVTGINTSAFMAAAGVRIDWRTGAIVAGRRLTGRTFLVPTGSTVFDTVGRVTAGNVTAVQTAGNTLQTSLTGSGDLTVWSRTHAVQHNVVSNSVPTKGSVLRGRRD